MSDLLQRLVQNARGTAQPNPLRIEPVLASRYAGKPSTSGLTPQELHVELTPPVLQRETALPAAPLWSPTITSEPPTNRVATQVDSFPVADIVPLTRHLDPDAPVLFAGDLADTVTRTKAAAIHSPLPLSSEPDRRESAERTRHAMTTQVMSPATEPPRPSPKPALRPTASATQPTTSTPTMPVEQTQSITISIGHVEVRNAASPAPVAPRKPAFRPGVSLDAFLRRGGGDGR
ncbi:hypothetical protein [Rhodanobacter sp. C05]|uniref:hypothetical protein n=1 Tax=Rhodanobacter sp. C05 TaxID=1945855 RepID=UPI000986A214|nr:hypothetical protein [Rhodanobacter sp. C05]OOG37426.1 hypothetical protein B0E51_16360 [Rhodanobacter sp. C05]